MKDRRDHIRRQARQRERDTRRRKRSDARDLARLLRTRKATK